MIGVEDFIFYAGGFYISKLLVNLLWDVHSGLKSYVFPKIFSVDYKKKYGEWAVITGCTQGIGRFYAEELAQKGMNIVLISRSQSKLEEVAVELNKTHGMFEKLQI